MTEGSKAGENVQLLPCPFCAGVVIAGPEPMGADAYGHVTVWIECETCAASFEFCAGDAETGKRMCVDAWNRRP